jgi:hypothetical protein
MNKKWMSAFVVLSALGGCVIQDYVPPQSATMTKIYAQKLESPWMCLDGKIYKLTKDFEGYAPIPTGRRITVGENFFRANGTCKPALSLIPNQGVSYYGESKIDTGKCYINVVRVLDVSPLRFGPEPSVGQKQPHCDW